MFNDNKTEIFTQLNKIGATFRLPGSIYAYDVITNGNINMTIKVTFRYEDGHLKSYIFQRINSVVFSNPGNIMSNIDHVTSFIREKYPSEVSLHFHHTSDGKNFYSDQDGNFWRVMNYVDSVTFNTCDDLAVVAATGEAFGHFQMQLADFDGSVLYETIPDFHNTHKRLDTLFGHIRDNLIPERIAEAGAEIEYIRLMREKASMLSDMYSGGEIPVRVTHNDTKSNNVLFDKETKRPIVGIDLDTVMPGMAIYDFADAVRFICNTSAEDEPDVSKVFFDTAKFRAFCKGYLGEVKETLTQIEINSLVLAAFSITIELASRFLDDYITGDKYFKINYPAHNLVRTRCQLKLAQDILLKRDELEWIVKDILKV